MNILFLTSRFPFPPIGGDRLRPYHFIKELSKRHNVHLLSFVHKEEINYVDDDIKKRIKISAVKHSNILSYLKTAMNILKSDPLQVSYYYSRIMRRRLNAIMKSEKIDLVFIHLIRMAKYAEHLRGVRKIIDYSDSFELLYNRSLNVRKGISKFIDYIENKRVGRFEKECMFYFDNAIISSHIDKKWIVTDINHDKINIITNGIEILDRDGINREYKMDISNNIAFIGNMRSFSNMYAITNFILNIFPLVKKYKKNVKLFVIGNRPPKSLKRFIKDKNILVTGYVNDVDAYLKRCCIGIAPMMSCSGVQNKILKYMSLKIPTVTTRAALGDLEATPGRDIIVAESEEEFASQVVSLLEDRAKQNEIGENGYKYVMAKHNWEKIVNRLNDLIIS